MNTYCPFLKDECSDDCVFSTRTTATSDGTYKCLIAIKLSCINEYQQDQFSELLNTIQK